MEKIDYCRDDKISTTDFCNKFYEWYDIGTYKSEMEQNKRIWLDELSTIVGDAILNSAKIIGLLPKLLPQKPK